MTATAATTTCGQRSIPVGPLRNSYSCRIEDDERRHKAGERQLFCGICQKWHWESTIDPAHRSACATSQEFWAFARKMERQLKAERRVADKAVERYRRGKRRA